MNPLSDLTAHLPAGVESVVIPDVAGLDMHCLVAGKPRNPLVLLLHGFPELAFSWRKIIPSLADAGFFVVAPDQRGYGRTRASSHRGTAGGWVVDYEDDFHSGSLCRIAGDACSLVAALGFTEVHAVVGHDFGSPVAGTCALLRPDLFKSVVMMSAPFTGAPPVQLRDRFQDATTVVEAVASGAESPTPSLAKIDPEVDLPSQLAALDQPRVHYQWYYSTPAANHNMWKPAGGLLKFLRDYYHHKSGDWAGNTIYALENESAEQFARLPTYYVMEAGKGMVETVAEHSPGIEHVANCEWLPDAELQVYVDEYSRTGFQGGLQTYRCNTGGVNLAELRAFAGKRIEVPSLFVAGNRDWGVYQFPGAIEALETDVTSDYRGKHLVEGAGHWVQQENPEAVVDILLPFLLP